MRLIAALALLAPLVVFAGCGPAPSPTAGPAAVAGVPPELGAGEALFNAKCAACHGAGAQGTETGPPFLHALYVPGHHGDDAFVNAAKGGVQAHHWQFGDMPPVEGVTEGDVREIVAYVRWLQAGATPGIH